MSGMYRQDWEVVLRHANLITGSHRKRCKEDIRICEYSGCIFTLAKRNEYNTIEYFTNPGGHGFYDPELGPIGMKKHSRTDHNQWTDILVLETHNFTWRTTSFTGGLSATEAFDQLHDFDWLKDMAENSEKDPERVALRLWEYNNSVDTFRVRKSKEPELYRLGWEIEGAPKSLSGLETFRRIRKPSFESMRDEREVWLLKGKPEVESDYTMG